MLHRLLLLNVAQNRINIYINLKAFGVLQVRIQGVVEDFEIVEGAKAKEKYDWSVARPGLAVQGDKNRVTLRKLGLNAD